MTPRPPSPVARRSAPVGTDPPAVRWLRRTVWLVLVLAVGVFLVRGADRPHRPRLVPANGTVPSAFVRPFDEVGFTVLHPTSATGAARTSHCALLANTEALRQQGLMNRKDLGGYDAMIFQWPAPTQAQFYMKDTVIPLSVAWFGQAGNFLAATDMVPCLIDPCPLHSAPSAYMVAIEVQQGSLSYLGIGSGSSIAVGGPCGA